MTQYQLLLVAGISLLGLATILVFTAGWRDRPKGTGLAVFMLAGGALLGAQQISGGTMQAGDIPEAFGRLIGMFF